MKRVMNARALKLNESARQWAKSTKGQRSVKKAVESANKATKRMQEAQEPISVSACEYGF